MEGDRLGGYRRYGIYVVPEGELHAAGAAWLGWDAEAGIPVDHPDVPGLPAAAELLTPNAAQIRLPRDGETALPSCGRHRLRRVLHAAAEAFCRTQAPVTIPTLEVRRLGGFIAVVPSEPSAELADLAAATVEALDAFRAPPSEAELARRRKARLTERQETLLMQWGYPYVMEEFRFHLTLTGRLDPVAADQARAALLRATSTPCCRAPGRSTASA